MVLDFFISFKGWWYSIVMKTQVVIIHGGTTFETYSDYLQYLKETNIDIERLKPGFDWKQGLQQDLGDNYEVLAPKMPNSTNAKYGEWKLWFNNILAVTNKNIVLVGHSLGGVFLAKYLSEETVNKNIEKLILVAAPYTDTPEESLASFRIKQKLTNVIAQAKTIVLIHSTDDPVVPFGDMTEYSNRLPTAQTVVFEDRQHFNQEQFKELTHIIKQ